MSKMLVYLLDKFVWLLLVAVLTTQALQIAGVVESPKTLAIGDMVVYNGVDYEYSGRIRDNFPRDKRQAGDRSPIIDNLFNERQRPLEGEFIVRRNTHYKNISAKIWWIPIATLNAVNDLVQSSRPVFRKFREAAQKRFEEVQLQMANAKKAASKDPKKSKSKPVSVTESMPVFNTDTTADRRQQRAKENADFGNEGPIVQPDGSSSRVLLRV